MPKLRKKCAIPTFEESLISSICCRRSVWREWLRSGDRQMNNGLIFTQLSTFVPFKFCVRREARDYEKKFVDQLCEKNGSDRSRRRCPRLSSFVKEKRELIDLLPPSLSFSKLV